MNIDAADRHGPTSGDLSFNSKLGLLGIRILIIRLGAEQHAERRGGACMRDVDSERGQVGRSDASCIARSRSCALNFARREKCLEDAWCIQDITRANARRGSSRRVDRNKRLRDLPVAVDQTQRLDNISYLTVDGRVENAITGANDGLVVLKGI